MNEVINALYPPFFEFICDDFKKNNPEMVDYLNTAEIAFVRYLFISFCCALSLTYH